MKKIAAILQLFPVLLNATKAVEEAIPLPGRGTQKLDLVLDVLKQAYDASALLSESFSWEALVAVVVPMIAKIVAVHNELGLFATSAATKA